MCRMAASRTEREFAAPAPRSALTHGVSSHATNYRIVTLGDLGRSIEPAPRKRADMVPFKFVEIIVGSVTYNPQFDVSLSS